MTTKLCGNSEQARLRYVYKATGLNWNETNRTENQPK